MVFSILLFIYLLILSYDDIRLKKVPVFMLKIGLAAVCIWLFSDAFLPMPPSEPVRRVVTALLGAFPGGALTGLSLISDKVGKGRYCYDYCRDDGKLFFCNDPYLHFLRGAGTCIGDFNVFPKSERKNTYAVYSFCDRGLHVSKAV